jgi:glutamate synthase domain-containing protein 1
MCGIAGFLDKSGRNKFIGQMLLPMLEALGCRGPDSSGVAVWGEANAHWILRVKLGESDENAFDSRADAVADAAGAVASIHDINVVGAYTRLIVDRAAPVEPLLAAIEAVHHEIEVVSCGHSLQIVKQVGSPQQLEATFGVASMTGTHGIGHTRLSTESRIDLSHSQPFGAHGLPDVATVHNGHITNYHKLRRIYEQRGVRFYTENDSEIIGVYLRDRMARGDNFEEALRASQRDFDGSFCYLAANENSFAYVKDGFGFKPLVMAETDDWVAIATEEIALRNVLGDGFAAIEPPARSLQIWHAQQPALV